MAIKQKITVKDFHLELSTYLDIWALLNLLTMIYAFKGVKTHFRTLMINSNSKNLSKFRNSINHEDATRETSSVRNEDRRFNVSTTSYSLLKLSVK